MENFMIKTINSKEEIIRELESKGLKLERAILITHDSGAKSVCLNFENQKYQINFEIGEDLDIITAFQIIDKEIIFISSSTWEAQLNGRNYETLEELFLEERI